MSPRCLFFSIAAGVIFWALVAAWYLDNGPLLLLAVFAALTWVWGAVVWPDIHRSSDDNENAPARGLDARGRTTRR
jgi:vacuolar-type H+-ATPase subunit I/STV1